MLFCGLWIGGERKTLRQVVYTLTWGQFWLEIVISKYDESSVYQFSQIPNWIIDNILCMYLIMTLRKGTFETHLKSYFLFSKSVFLSGYLRKSTSQNPKNLLLINKWVFKSGICRKFFPLDVSIQIVGWFSSKYLPF